METTLTIDGKQVRFRKTGGTMLAYKREFGRDYLADLSGIIKAQEAVNKLNNAPDDEDQYDTMSELVSQMDFEVYFNLVYILAKSADPAIPDQLTWLDTFDDFPILDIFTQLMPMLDKEMKVDPKNALPTAAKHPAG